MKPRRIGCFLVAVALLIGVRSFFYPPDWIEVHLDRVPGDVASIYVIAEVRGKVQALHWYHSKVSRGPTIPRSPASSGTGRSPGPGARERFSG